MDGQHKAILQLCSALARPHLKCHISFEALCPSEKVCTTWGRNLVKLLQELAQVKLNQSGGRRRNKEALKVPTNLILLWCVEEIQPTQQHKVGAKYLLTVPKPIG